MNSEVCREFELWLEQLPNGSLPHEFDLHLETCSRCKARYAELAPITTRLTQWREPSLLDPVHLSMLVEHTQKAVIRRESRKTAIRLSVIGFLCLPILVAINWVWAITGYDLIAGLSPVLARVYLTVFVVSATAIAGLLYGSIPVLVGFVRPLRIKERVG